MAVRAVMRLALSVDGAPAPQVSIHVHLSRSRSLTRFLAPSCLPLSLPPPGPHAWLLPAWWTGQSEGGGATKGAVRIVALGDLFPERVEGARKGLAEKGEMGTVPEKNCFTGFDAYKGVIATDCDVVILATPPGFRPSHFKAAVDAGKHVFMEKAVAVDAPGVRTVLAVAADAERR